MTERTVIVLGAGGGLGRAVTERFRDDGASVLAFDARVPAGEERQAVLRVQAIATGPQRIAVQATTGAGAVRGEETITVIPPAPGDVELEVGAHAHDPEARLVRLGRVSP